MVLVKTPRPKEYTLDAMAVLALTCWGTDPPDRTPFPNAPPPENQPELPRPLRRIVGSLRLEYTT